MSKIEKFEKYQFAPATLLVEGVGNENFSNLQLLGLVGGIPLVLLIFLGLGYAWYPFLAVLLAFPIFCLYNIGFAITGSPVRPAVFPGKPVQEYITIRDPVFAQYKGKNKIPMETFFEAYFDEKIDINGDMLDLLEKRYDWAKFTFTWSQFKFFATQWIPETLWHSRIQDETQVRDHYDRGDDFYEAFLGPMMIYTSGIVNNPNGARESLEEIQQHKLDLVTDKIHLKSGEKMLDIGCGWGTLAVHAAKKGADVTGVTLGRNQHKWAMDKATIAGVQNKVKILCMDYRDIPKEKYDKITCLEMSEHVGVLRFQTFLLQVREMLKDDGVFFLQIAGLRRAWQYEDFIWGLFMAKYVFPGADASCPLYWVIEQLERAGFEVQSSDTIGVHYSATIFRWYINWIKNKDKIISKYGVRWFRKWEYFLAYSTIISRQGSATCYQLVCHKNLNSFDRTRFLTRKL